MIPKEIQSFDITNKRLQSHENDLSLAININLEWLVQKVIRSPNAITSFANKIDKMQFSFTEPTFLKRQDLY